MDFKSILKYSQKEVNSQTFTGNSKKVLDAVLRQVDIVTTLHPEVSEIEVVNKITHDVLEYLKKINDTEIVSGTIEYYLGRQINSPSGYNLDRAYKDICKAEKDGEIDFDSIADYTMEYGFSLNENLRRIIILLLKDIREEKKKASDWLDAILKAPEKRKLLSLSEKKRKMVLRSLGVSDEAIENLKETIKLVRKSELEILREELKYRTESKLGNLKQECISKIVESVGILDSIGLIEEYKNLGNKLYNAHRLPRYQYSTDEIKELLSEDYLKKLSVEQLIALTSFWVNRVNKILPDLNKGRHIVNHLLHECTVWENGKKKIVISEEYLKAIELKKRVLHKICFELFQEVDALYDKGPEVQDMWIKKEIKKLCKEHGSEYTRYFDRLLPHIENSLQKDLIEGFFYENTIYNSYRIKDFNMESILISLLNNNLGQIENFGYIKEDDEKITKKKFVLIGIDLQGMNMPLRLHVNRSLLIEILKQSQNGSTLFPIYRGRKDFEFANGDFIPTHIYVPMSDEKKKQLQEDRERAEGKINEKTKRMLDHLCYISCKGDMPEHMKKKNSPKLIDIAGEEEELER